MNDFICFLTHARDELFRICQSPSRQEHVGLLLGKDATVERVIGLENLRPMCHGHGFRIAVDEIEKLRQRHSEFKVLGRFHTHPNAPARRQ